MQLAKQTSQLFLPLAANLALGQCHPLFQIWSLLALKNKMVTGKMQTPGFKTAVHKPMSDITDATSNMHISALHA